jgi:hypothetical protein
MNTKTKIKNFNRINIIDDFFNINEFYTIKTYQECLTYIPSYQPAYANYSNRFKGYPVWEVDLEKDNPIFNFLLKNLELKFSNNFNIENIILRKIYTDELLRSSYRGREYGMVHKDDVGLSMAGVIYLNGESIKGGTYLFSNELQVEPEIIVGSKPNRCIIYDTNILHSPGIEWEDKVRNVLVFFLKNKE